MIWGKSYQVVPIGLIPSAGNKQKLKYRLERQTDESRLKIIEGREVDVEFIEFSKAFDFVCHDVLFAKLCRYGVHGDLLDWCGDYLKEGQQLVVVKGEASDQLTVISGVSQGSLLGPIFFIVYINDLWGWGGLISKDSSIALYANDSKLYRLSGRSRGGLGGPPPPPPIF